MPHSTKQTWALFLSSSLTIYWQLPPLFCSNSNRQVKSFPLIQPTQLLSNLLSSLSFTLIIQCALLGAILLPVSSPYHRKHNLYIVVGSDPLLSAVGSLFHLRT